MQFLWPSNLWWMLALPALVALYLWLLRRPAAYTVRLPSLEVVRAAASRPWRRHVPPALVLAALALLALALGRPIGQVTLPGARTTILLALDVSLSMRVSDVKPTRMLSDTSSASRMVVRAPGRVTWPMGRPSARASSASAASTSAGGTWRRQGRLAA
ncbi:MAG: BatA domain-containing protein, partial [Rubrivivax sp.]